MCIGPLDLRRLLLIQSFADNCSVTHAGLGMQHWASASALYRPKRCMGAWQAPSPASSCWTSSAARAPREAC